MSESRAHIELVNKTVDYVKTIVPDEFRCYVKYDSPDSSQQTAQIQGFIPDVYYWNENTLIVGEAKTLNDFGRQHSIEQYHAYLEECRNFYGNAKLVVCVPWQIIATAKNYFRHLKNELGCEEVSVVIISEFGDTSFI